MAVQTLEVLDGDFFLFVADLHLDVSFVAIDVRLLLSVLGAVCLFGALFVGIFFKPGEFDILKTTFLGSESPFSTE